MCRIQERSQCSVDLEGSSHLYTEGDPARPRPGSRSLHSSCKACHGRSLSAEMGVEVRGKVDIGGHLPHHLLLSNFLGPWKRQRVWGRATCLPTVGQEGQRMGSIPEESTRWRCCPSLGARSCPCYCRSLTSPGLRSLLPVGALAKCRFQGPGILMLPF